MGRIKYNRCYFPLKVNDPIVKVEVVVSLKWCLLRLSHVWLERL